MARVAPFLALAVLALALAAPAAHAAAGPGPGERAPPAGTDGVVCLFAHIHDLCDFCPTHPILGLVYCHVM